MELRRESANLQSPELPSRRATRREVAYPGLRPLVHAFYRAVRGAAPPPVTAHESLDVAVARDSVIARMDRLSTRVPDETATVSSASFEYGRR